MNNYCFSEKYLQIIWNERMFSPRPRCTDGRSLRVLSTGLWNRGPGPDFQNASILIDRQLFSGDIEIHCKASEWFSHHHENDPRYDHVILHVVWENDLPATSAPAPSRIRGTLELGKHLHPRWLQMLSTVECTYYPMARMVPPGACMMRWAMTNDDALVKILTEAGENRMARRGAFLLRQSAQCGDLDQCIYENVFECLGYSGNRRQFRQLAQAVPLKRLCELGIQDEYMVGALILGSAGMLPDPTTCRILPELKAWIDKTWHIWWQLGSVPIPIIWDQSATRPLNCVLRRLLAGIYWLIQCKGSPEKWLREIQEKSCTSPKKLLQLLTLPLPDNPVWHPCISFDRRVSHGAALLGTQRLLDIAINVYLPVLYADAEIRNAATMQDMIRDAYLSIPRMAGNLTLRNACLRFLSPPSRERDLLKKAAHQQGLMEIYKQFCLALNTDCNNCPFVTESGADKKHH